MKNVYARRPFSIAAEEREHARGVGGNQMAGGLNVWIDDDIMSAPLPGSIMIFLET